MNIKKILIISLFLLILASLTIGASYAATSEKIVLSTDKYIQTYDKKIASIHWIQTWDKKNDLNEYCKVYIKKTYQNKYKIQSVKCQYIVYNSELDEEEIIYKTYDGKNKNSLTFKLDNSLPESLKINYLRKDKIKSESTKFRHNTMKFYSHSEFEGKKSNIKVIEKGYFSYIPKKDYTFYRKFNIKTISKKDKIKTIKVIYIAPNSSISKTETYNGKGKTSFTKVIKGKFYDRSYIGKFKVTYF